MVLTAAHQGLNLIVLHFTAFLLARGQCPNQCRCNVRRQTVYCNEKQLKFIPSQIPTNTKNLFLQGNEIANSLAFETSLKHVKNLQKLHLQQNKLTFVPNPLPGCLKFLFLGNNRINKLNQQSFEKLQELEELELDRNQLDSSRISNLTFQALVSLKILTMSWNKLSEIPNHLPTSLVYLRLDFNRIKTVTVNITKSLTKLILLDLSHNEISQVDSKALFQLPFLKTLKLKSNMLTRIPIFLPSSLKELYLSENRIERVTNIDTQRLAQVTRLSLSANQLENIAENAFENMQRLEEVDLYNNPWHCDCRLQYLKEWLQETTSVLSNSKNLKCHMPKQFRGRSISSAKLTLCSQTIAAPLPGNITQIRKSPFKLVVTEVTMSQAKVCLKTENTILSKKYKLQYRVLECLKCSFAYFSRKQIFSRRFLFNGANISCVYLSKLTKNSTYKTCVVNKEVKRETDVCQTFTTGAKIDENKKNFPSRKFYFSFFLIVFFSCVIAATLAAFCAIRCFRKKKIDYRDLFPLCCSEICGLGYFDDAKVLDAGSEFDISLHPRFIKTWPGTSNYFYVCSCRYDKTLNNNPYCQSSKTLKMQTSTENSNKFYSNKARYNSYENIFYNWQHKPKIITGAPV